MLNTLWLWLNDIRVIKAKGKKKKKIDVLVQFT